MNSFDITRFLPKQTLNKEPVNLGVIFVTDEFIALFEERQVY